MSVACGCHFCGITAACPLLTEPGDDLIDPALPRWTTARRDFRQAHAIDAGAAQHQKAHPVTLLTPDPSVERASIGEAHLHGGVEHPQIDAFLPRL